ncbi:Undecaprenyl phosphate-alpha-4-amino-4-deoxy-L-arabinose arabinosyl transferase [Oligella sp. MSHR50489EDL]|uniref:ArnT family glycosyltransferase n=1 Tax=Oligella sp. MSHR50489EDL TaxID=3139409 RepID=UPI003D81274C
MKLFDRPLFLLSLILLALLPVMALMPFSDTTEPRYAEIARLMLERNDWITPWFDPQTPFLGKPPLSFWLQALSMKLFGVSEFAARFPSWLSLCGGAFLLYRVVQQIHSSQQGLWAAVIYVSTALSFTAGAGVLTDPFLNFGLLLALVSFVMVIEGQRTWRYGFFIGLSIALLAKGPLALVLLGVPLVLWIALSLKERIALLKRFSWRSGLIITAVLVLPWYILAEIKTPGFLRYFIVGEHYLRFLDSGWKGDMYGTAHEYMRGTIWWFALQAMAPWSLVLIAFALCAPFSSEVRVRWQALPKAPYFSLFLCYGLFVPAFFTLSGNVLWTYVLPAIPAFAYLLSVMIVPYFVNISNKYRAVPIATALLMPVAAIVLCVMVLLVPNQFKTEKYLIQSWQKNAPECLLYYVDKAPFSARFYSAEQSQNLRVDDLDAWLQEHKTKPLCIAVSKRDEESLKYLEHYQDDIVFTSKRYILFKLLPELHALN